MSDMSVGVVMKGIGGLALVAAVATGCGDDDEDAGGDVERYCQLVDELDQAGTEFFAALEENESAPDEDFANAEQQFLEENADDIEELREAAPVEIADDIDVLLAAQAQRAAGGDQEESSEEAAAAEERVLNFADANCTDG